MADAIGEIDLPVEETSWKSKLNLLVIYGRSVFDVLLIFGGLCDEYLGCGSDSHYFEL